MHNKIADQLELDKAADQAVSDLVDPRPGDPHQFSDLVEQNMPAPTPEVDLAAAQARVQYQRANAMLRTAFAARRARLKAGHNDPPKPTGVRMLSANGVALDVYDDGSHRKEWKRNPELSGRQFRKLRKQANKAWRAQRRAAQETINASNPDPVPAEEALPDLREPAE
jgi:hypothetical protein